MYSGSHQNWVAKYSDIFIRIC